MPTSTDRVKKYLQFKKANELNPSLAGFLGMEKMERQFEERVNMLIADAEQKIREAIGDSLLKEFELVEKHGKKAAQDEIKVFREETSERIKTILASFKKDKEDILAELKSEIQREARKIWSGIEREHRVIMENIESMRGPTGERGMDGQSIVGSAGKDGKDGSPDMAEDIRNKLELLSDGEKLKIDAIEDLREELDKLKMKKGGTVYVGGGSSSGGHIVKVYSLSSQLNGVLKTFSLPAFWRVLNVHSTSFPNSAFEPTTDYMVDGSAMTITFTAQIDASTTLAAEQTLLIEYAES